MVDLKSAEERNQWFAAHWNDGIPLEIMGVDIGDALKYNVLNVLGTLWLQYAAEMHEAERLSTAEAASQPVAAAGEKVLTVDDVVTAAQTLAAVAGLSADDVLQALNAARDQKAAAAAQQAAAVALDAAQAGGDSQEPTQAAPGASTGDDAVDDKRIDNGGADV